MGQGTEGAAEGALDLPARSRSGEGRADLLANKIKRLVSIQTSFSTIRTVAHNLKITAILKLSKLALCPLLHPMPC